MNVCRGTLVQLQRTSGALLLYVSSVLRICTSRNLCVWVSNDVAVCRVWGYGRLIISNVCRIWGCGRLRLFFNLWFSVWAWKVRDVRAVCLHLHSRRGKILTSAVTVISKFRRNLSTGSKMWPACEKVTWESHTFLSRLHSAGWIWSCIRKGIRILEDSHCRVFFVMLETWSVILCYRVNQIFGR
jgi:hypothetical protein